MTHTCARTQVSRPRRDTYQVPADAPPAPSPSHAEIARLAYTYWEARGRRHGYHLEDWCRAERELLDRRTPPVV